MEQLKIALVGAGYIGSVHAAAYSLLPEAQLTAVIDTNLEAADRLSQEYKSNSYPSLDEAFASSDIDIVDICLPTQLHKDAVVKALINNKNVIVEKPFAIDDKDMEAMIHGAKRSNNKLMVAHVVRFIPQYAYVNKIVKRNQYGKPLYFNAWRLSETPDWSWNNWLQDINKSGGTLLDLSVHDLDIANWLLGEPISFYGQEVFKSKTQTGPSHVVSSINYSSGAKATIEASHLMPKGFPFTTGFRLVMEKGVIEYRASGENWEFYVTDEKGRHEINRSKLDYLPGGNPYAQELKHFIDCCIHNKETIVSLSEARLAVQTSGALRKSIQNECIIFNKK